MLIFTQIVGAGHAITIGGTTTKAISRTTTHAAH